MSKDFETDPSIVKKRHLKRVLRCDKCPPHRGENVTRVKFPVKKPKRKNKRRK